MNFVNPWFLFALSAIAIPVIIHLYNFRRFKKVLFSNISFLKELSEEKKRQSKLKNLLILIARLLAVIFLVLAFSRPYIPGERVDISREGNVVSIYVDNSFSMEALSGRGRLIDEAKLLAEEIAEQFPATDQFHLLTNDFKGVHQRLVSREDFIRSIKDIELSPVFRSLSEVYHRQKSMLDESHSESKNIFMISDFQKNICDFNNFNIDTNISSFFIPVEAKRSDNLYIDTLWFESPVKLIDQPVEINIKISNDGNMFVDNQPLRLYVNEELRSVASFDIHPGETITKQLSYTIKDTVIQQGFVEIADHPVVFDDKMYFSFSVIENIPVLSINEDIANERYFNALFDNESFYYQSMSYRGVDYSQNPNTLILNGLNDIPSGMQMEISRFVEEGGSLIVFPGKKIDFDSYKTFLTSLNANYYESLDTTSLRVNSLNYLHNIYHGVFEEEPDDVHLPEVYKHYKINERVGSSGDYLMRLQNGNILLSSQNFGNGVVYLSAVPLNEKFSNFPVHPIFVPTLYNIALFSVPQAETYNIIGKETPIRIREQQAKRDPVYKIRGKEIEIIPEVRIVNNRVNLLTHNQIQKAGNYSIYTEDELLQGLSLNYDRRESELDSYNANELDDKIKDYQLGNTGTISISGVSVEKALEKQALGNELWQICLLLVLLFVLTEILLLRFWK